MESEKIHLYLEEKDNSERSLVEQIKDTKRESEGYKNGMSLSIACGLKESGRVHLYLHIISSQNFNYPCIRALLW